jgi:hypothetical protein
MSEDEARRKSELISKAKAQLAAVTTEFQRGLTAVKDPAQRRKLTDAYLDLVQKYLAKAQDSLAHHRSKDQPTQPTNPDDGPVL